MDLKVYLKCIRWKNLLLIGYVFILIKFVLFPSYQIHTILSNFQFFVLLASVVFITAAGYIINDIFDITTDFINKPKKVIIPNLVSVEKAKTWYKVTNALGVTLGVFLCLKIEKPNYSFIFLGSSLLLYFYSKKLKGLPFIGNVVVAFLVCSSIFIIVIFELNYPVENPAQFIVLQFIVLLSFVAFLINLIRELTKDLIDVNGDYKMKMNTLPILIGISRTKKIALFICLIIILFLLYFVINYSSEYKYLNLYLVVFILLPLLYTSIKLNKSTTKKQFQKISIWLKIIMFLGVNSILIFSKF
ncbi:geranylgeranylglycerol-phosphate geranylgeranyltransferase [Lutibacter holmesii]|uniref:Geranylgeranylglycerol-phosphate geranylgeranyltransferase n=1 Tax=Lutibacter holmesii TaxID=1137985 RepID=A0ABW3WRV9_9FLAO